MVALPLTSTALVYSSHISYSNKSSYRSTHSHSLRKLRKKMLSNIGLYYPFNRFRDDAWVKLAALYWDKLGRIVPSGYAPHDSNTIQQLTNELSFFENFEPSNDDIKVVDNKFLDMLQNYDYDSDLPSYYRIDTQPKWLDDPITVLLAHWSSAFWIPPSNFEPPQGLDPQFSYIHSSSESKLASKLVELGLAATVGKRRDPYSGPYNDVLLGMHPRLAYIYMEVLAEQMASARQLHPVADTILDHLAVSGYSLERLTQALLRPNDEKAHPTETSTAPSEIEVQMATIALQSVLPQDIANVPTKQIIKLRKKHRDEMTSFQTYLHDFVNDLGSLQDITDSVALKAHLDTAYEKKLKPQLDDLRKCLQSLGMETITGAINVRVALPSLLVGGGAYLAQGHIGPVNTVLAGTGAIAFSLFPVIQEKQKDARKVIHSAPTAYLLYLQEGLAPAKLTSWVAQHARQMLFRI